ncbi:MAG: rhodanese-like domain-containing protein [Elusimicrobia bacterium]|nr:rhodanese-like domain-containing protein [Elusimicrobiota bacterium]
MANIFATKTQEQSAVDYFKSKLRYDMSPYGLKALLDEKASGYRIVDVRSPEDFDEGHIPTALNIPLEDLPGMLSSLPKDKIIVTYCGSITCQLAPKAALELAQKGFKVMELHGGLKEWTSFGYPVEKTA